MLLPMTRVQIVGTKPRRAQTIRVLHRLGTVQIIEWHEDRAKSQQRMEIDSEAVHRREQLAYLHTQVEALLIALPDLKPDPLADYEALANCTEAWLMKRVQADLAEAEPQIQAQVTRRADLEEKLNSLPRYEATLKRLLPLVPAIVDLENYTVTAIWVERRYQEILQSIIDQLEEITAGQCEVISGPVEADLLAAVLVFPKAQAKAVANYLGQENISQVRLPKEFTGQPLSDALAAIRTQLEAIPRQLEAAKARLQELAREWQPRLMIWQALLADHLARIDVCHHLGQTDYTFVIEGWIPAERAGSLQATLASEVGDEVVMTTLSPAAAEQEDAPVAFDNPRLIKPFEPLIQILALPRYGGFDPTPLMAVFMPLFFGLILGDIGYGLILLGLMLYLRRRFKYRPTLASLTEVMMIGSLWTIFFGFLFGELFGTLGEAVGLHPLWFDRGHDVQSLFLLTIGIGAGHIVLGLCLGVWQSVRQGNRHQLLEKVAMLTALMALFLLAAVLADYLPASFFTPAIALLVVGLAILIYTIGKIGFFLAPLEILELVGNILSYLRIAAIGLSSIYLAMVANELAGFAGNVVVGLIIAVLFHALNIALGAFSPTIQSLRLHYVEFFGKFYDGGGEPFRPFRRATLRPK